MPPSKTFSRREDSIGATVHPVEPNDVTRALAALTTSLRGGPNNRESAVDDSSSADMAAAIIRHRLSRLVVNSNHPLALDKEDMERITNDALAHTHAAFQLVSHTSRVAGILDAKHINFLVIKGVALGALSQTPAGRGAGDVDILVGSSDVPRVHQIFCDAGFRPALAQPDVMKAGAWAVWSFLDREATYVGHGTHVDLHWRISSQRRLFPSFDELFPRKTSVTVADTAIPTLSLADSLAAACYHSYFDQFQPLRSLLDVVSMVTATQDTALPTYSRPLQQLIAGVLDLTRTLLPGVADDHIAALMSTLPAPHPFVKKRFAHALASPKVVWEENQDTGAVWSKMRAEAAFDSAVDIVPRFIGKRLFHFPHSSEAKPTTSFAQAFKNRIQVESGRKKRQRRLS